ncbi:MAG: hypothetical protein WC712_12520 [Candidatus Brocadiia bacterium]
MIDYFNPFEYEAATKFTPEQVLDFYIEDFNYSRFVHSRRNIFLVGERGTGKTMTLRYNSLPVQHQAARRQNKETDYELVCVYIPCKTPLTHKQEYQLLEEFQASVINEHFLVLPIMYGIADTISQVPGALDGADEERLRQELAFTLSLELPPGMPLLEGLKQCLQREVARSQRAINARQPEAFYDGAVSFSAGVLPLITCLRQAPALRQSHFALMMDDAHDLNLFQTKILNSWIAYRDNTLFSFKLAVAKVERPTLITSSGGTILEGHDFTLVDMEQPYQNRYSSFGKLARRIIECRLSKIGVKESPEEFFPENPQFTAELGACRQEARAEAQNKYPDGDTKKITDHVYKYARAKYFGGRSPKAGRPPYSGFDMLVHMSTGVIRNLLEPCYWMYDRAISEANLNQGQAPQIQLISPTVQTEVIMERSRRKWEWLREGLDKSIEGCSKEQATQLFQLFDNLAVHFWERLRQHESEPRATIFVISETAVSGSDELQELLEIARRAQVLYVYTSSAKDHGKREPFYVPNRMLWPERGLDPQGQHARVSIKARHLLAAAQLNQRIPLEPEQEEATKGLFDE